MEHILLPQGLNFSLWQLISKDDLQCTKLPSIHRFVGSSPALTMARQVNSWTFAFRSLKLIQPLAQSNCNLVTIYLSSVQFSHSVVSDSLWPHGLQHTRPPCPLPIPGVYSNSHPLSQWCLPTISPSVIPFSSRLQSFLALGSFQMSSSSHQVAKVLEFQLQH